MRSAVEDVLAERLRQMTEEGWGLDHDDRHDERELAKAGACYASFAAASDEVRKSGRWSPGSVFTAWPFGASWWKPKDRRRDLVRAAALLIAEIERLDRGEVNGERR